MHESHHSFSEATPHPQNQVSREYEKETNDRRSDRLFLGGLLGSLGDLASLVGLDDRLDDTDSNGLAHVTDGETTERGVVSEGLNAHGLGGHHLDDGSVTRLDELGAVLNRLSGTAVDLLEELGELASNVGSVAIENWGVTSTNLTGVVQDDDLGVEGLSTLGGGPAWSHRQRCHDGSP